MPEVKGKKCDGILCRQLRYCKYKVVLWLRWVPPFSWFYYHGIGRSGGRLYDEMLKARGHGNIARVLEMDFARVSIQFLFNEREFERKYKSSKKLRLVNLNPKQ